MENSNKYTEKEFFLEKVYNITEKVRLGIYDEPDLETILNVSDVLPRDSNDYLKIKKRVDEKCGITSPRGCDYKTVIRVVASAVEAVNYHLQVYEDEYEDEWSNEGHEMSIGQYFDELDIDEDNFYDNVYGE